MAGADCSGWHPSAESKWLEAIYYVLHKIVTRVRMCSGMMRDTNLMLQVVILLTLLAGFGLNVEYWRAQWAFNQSTLVFASLSRISGLGVNAGIRKPSYWPSQVQVMVRFTQSALSAAAKTSA
jgi:hypothetical protein